MCELGCFIGKSGPFLRVTSGGVQPNLGPDSVGSFAPENMCHPAGNCCGKLMLQPMQEYGLRRIALRAVDHSLHGHSMVMSSGVMIVQQFSGFRSTPRASIVTLNVPVLMPCARRDLTAFMNSVATILLSFVWVVLPLIFTSWAIAGFENATAMAVIKKNFFILELLKTDAP
jgi:hypothetical protein